MTDRQIGYIALGALAAMAAVAGGLMARQVLQPSEAWVVRCSNVGTLRLADPVLANGVPIGQIERLGRGDNQALVTIRLSPPQPIHSDYTIVVVDLGIMGDRMMALDLGSPRRPVVRHGDTLQGEFVIGPSEAIAMVDHLEEVVLSFVSVAQRLTYGDVAHTPLVSTYARAIWFVDSVSERMLQMVALLDGSVTTDMDTLGRMLDAAARLTARASREGPAMVADVSRTMERVDSAVVKVDTMAGELRRAVARVQSPDAQALLAKIDSVQRTLRTVQEVLDDVRRRGVDLKVVPF